MDDIELPPLPYSDYVNRDVTSTEHGLWCKRYGPYDENKMHDYARAAILADRERRQPAPSAEAVGWQWLRTAHFRKNRPTEDPGAWRPLYTAPQPTLPPEVVQAMRRLIGHAASLLWLRTEGDPVTADKSLDLDEQICVLAEAIRADVDALRTVLGEKSDG